ncbi:MAG: hypothetical protein ABIN96_13770 [Rubrivivax sp.]
MPTAQAESSLLLLILASVVVALMAHVGFGYLRRLRLSPGLQGLRSQWLPIALVAAVLGTGLCASMVLALGAEALKFPIGYAAMWAPLLWLAACLACLPVVVLVIAGAGSIWLWLGGAVVGALATLVQAGWVEAIGFRPGVLWNTELQVLAALVQVAAWSAAFWLALSAFTAEDERALTWRGTAVLLLVLATAGAQEVLITAAGLSAQVGSVYAQQVSGAWLCVFAGSVVPVLFAFLAVGLALQTTTRRRSRRQSAELPGSARKRRRRHRIRTL